MQVMMEVQPTRNMHTTEAYTSTRTCQSFQFPGIKHLKEEYPDWEKPTLNTRVSQGRWINLDKLTLANLKLSSLSSPSDPNLISPPKSFLGPLTSADSAATPNRKSGHTQDNAKEAEGPLTYLPNQQTKPAS